MRWLRDLRHRADEPIPFAGAFRMPASTPSSRTFVSFRRQGQRLMLALIAVLPVAARADTTASISAAQTAAAHAPACVAVGNFYWEIGDSNGVVASGTVGTGYSATEVMRVASASKLVFGAYVLERIGRDGELSPDMLDELQMKSGYTSFNPIACRQTPTVAGCLTAHALHGRNDRYHSEDRGLFWYGSGHSQKLAVELGLGELDANGLTQEIRTRLGGDLNFYYKSPQLAGGLLSSPADFGLFLRRIVSGQLVMKDFLGTRLICTLPGSCPNAKQSPIPAPWHYSLNHWVEDDGSFSSPGLLGFYPWIVADKTHYGLVAHTSNSLSPVLSTRYPTNSAYWLSAQCGRAIRNAFQSGNATPLPAMP
ncbi:hypothetical protein [Azomonas macrocytogenes]|uniref:CubicO group peptidase (Beta-lactamase class C family) n=1 Tax=Azomonas macrocytogenes TaxID=69962 RepID=A0A839T644_AZOMA|nr:hypothetical protein [Azomonas macrocytogenes]MBB3103153.1 CubicO group peptidase (beta-lactamase class C family) [Azomonas macrocytogenes]